MAAGQTVLYVEDNQDNRILVRRILQADGYVVLEAENARQAVEFLRRGKPDLIIMDINLPEISGYTLTSKLKSHPDYSKIPVVALTANVMKGDRERSLQAGCDGYIEKPIDVDTFLNTIAYFIER